MGDLMAKKDYNLTEITRLLLKMRDNCVQKEGEMYNDPERQEKYEALQAAAFLIHNPSCLVDAEPVRHGRWECYPSPAEIRCSQCKMEYVARIRWNYCPNCGAKMDKNESEEE